MLTPLDIKQQRFKSRLFGGYDKEDVHTYLNTLSERWKQLIDEKKKLESEVEKLQARLAQYEQMEALLQRTLMQAEASSQQTLEAAKKEAQTIIKNAEAEAKTIIDEALRFKRKIELNVTQLVSFQEEVIDGLQSFLEFEIEKIKRFQIKRPPQISEPAYTQQSSPELPPTMERDGKNEKKESIQKITEKKSSESIAPNEPPVFKKNPEDNELIEEIIKELE